MVQLFFISLIMNVLINTLLLAKMKVIAVATIMGLVSTLIFLTTLYVKFAFATPLIDLLLPQTLAFKAMVIVVDI